MKKATAFLTLIGLLTISGSLIYAINHSDQQHFDSLISALTYLLPKQYHSLGLIALSLFWFAAFVTSLTGLFDHNGKIAEKHLLRTEENLKSPLISPLEEQSETILKSEFTELERKFQQFAQQQLQKENQLKSEVENLQAQLQKFSVSDKDSQRQEKLVQELAELKQQLKKFQSENQNLQKTLTKADIEIKKLEEEIRALQNKLNKAQEEAKSACREAEKTASALKTAQTNNEKYKQKLEEIQQENEKIKSELQAAMANVKSGKHGIPPAAYQILYLFQKEGRLIDLLMEDITEIDDETLGGAIRPIHEGCRKLLQERLIVEPVFNESEGSKITIEELDAESIKLSGNVPAYGPYIGELVHRGWRLKECHLPELIDGWKGNIIAPAEIVIS